MSTRTTPAAHTVYRHPGVPGPRVPTDAQVLAAVRSGVTTPEAARDGLGPAPQRRHTDRRKALQAGQWVDCGAMQVRLS